MDVGVDDTGSFCWFAVLCAGSVLLPFIFKLSVNTDVDFQLKSGVIL